MPKYIFKVKWDFSDVSTALRKFKAEVQREMARVGEEAVEYAKANGDYHDVTGRLRASNKYKVDGDTLKIYNDAPYAEDVESRGQDVIAGAATFAHNELKRITEK